MRRAFLLLLVLSPFGSAPGQEPHDDFVRRLLDAAAAGEGVSRICAQDPDHAAFVARDVLRAANRSDDERRARLAHVVAAALPDAATREVILGEVERQLGYGEDERRTARAFEAAVASAQEALTAGRGAVARADAERALDRARALGESYLEACAHSLHAAALRVSGDLDDAIDDLRTAVAIEDRIAARWERDRDRAALAAAFEARAAQRSVEGDYERTLDDLAAAVESWRAVDSRDDEGRCLVRLAGVQTELARFADAESSLAVALDRFASPGVSRARALLALAVCLLDQDRTGEALAALDRARAMIDRATDRAGAAAIALQLARARFEAGQPTAADHDAARALVLLGGDGDPLSRALAWTTRGDVSAALGEDAKAVAFYERALESGAEHAEARWRAHTGLGRVAERTDPEAAIAHYRVAVDDLERMRDLLRAPDLRVRALAERRVPYFRAARLHARRGEHADAFAMVSALHARTLWELQAPGARGKDVTPRRLALHGRVQPSLAAVQNALGAGELLLCFGVGDDGALCLVVSRRRVRELELALGAAALGDLTDRLLEPVRDLASGRVDAGNLRFPVDAAAALFESLIEPLDLGPARRLLIVADGPLRRVPFAALVTHRELRPVDPSVPYAQYHGCEYLIERREIAMLPIAALLETRVVLGPPRSGPALVVGAPEGLPGAVHEARAVARELGVRPLLGSQATKGACVAAFANAPIAHLALHAVLDGRRPDRSRLQVAPGQSGDGWITVGDIERAGLASPVVVLSGCDTAGRPSSSEGLLGLSRAFLAAGARTVVATAWPVDDAASARLMVDFHRALAERRGDAVAALREAQLSMLRRGRSEGLAIAHPFFWAGYVVHGVPSR